LELYDVLEYDSQSVREGSPFFLRRAKGGKVKVPYQVQFYHRKVGGKFDLDFVQREGAFVHDHLKDVVDGTTFFKSMKPTAEEGQRSITAAQSSGIT
jgi:hypothetical protein